MIALGIAFLIPRAWLGTLLGAAACGFTLLAMGMDWNRLLPQMSLFSLLGVTGIWLLMPWLLEKLSLDAPRAEALASMRG